MNTRRLISLAIVSFAGSAFAQEATSDEWMAVVSTKTRSQVLAELQQARADGSIARTRGDYLNPSPGNRSRGEVVRETLAATRSGEIARLNAEAHSFDIPAAGQAVYLAQTRD